MAESNAASSLANLLDLWSIREKERNEIVHGRFTIKSSKDSKWLVVNKILRVKKGITFISHNLLNAEQAGAFLKAIISERKRIETALENFPKTLSAE